jgi:isoquinoline 1-oxidoreductase beta subunit
MSSIQKISRRNFIYSLGLASGGLIIGCNLTTLGKTEFQLNPFNGKIFNPNLFIQLKDNGELILVASRSEMGNGVRTSLTSVLADEMDADWKYVKVTQATGDAKFLDQNTDGSRSIRTLFEPMRKMGATAKAMLINAAANKWNVDASELIAENHYVIDKKNNKKLFFGDLVEEAAKVEVPKKPKLKAYKDFKYIGKELKSVDGMAYVSGKAKFGLDIKLEGMKYAAIARCPVTFGTVKSFDKTAALKIPGVIDVIQIDKINRPFGILGGIAVIANNTWAAFKGKRMIYGLYITLSCSRILIT